MKTKKTRTIVVVSGYDDSDWTEPLEIGPFPYDVITERFIAALEQVGRSRPEIGGALGVSTGFIRHLANATSEPRISSVERLTQAMQHLGIHAEVVITATTGDPTTWAKVTLRPAPSSGSDS